MTVKYVANVVPELSSEIMLLFLKKFFSQDISEINACGRPALYIQIFMLYVVATFNDLTFYVNQ